MIKITALFIAMAVTGCASTSKTYEPSPQFYRAKGQETQTQITAKQNVIYSSTGRVKDNHVTIFFDGQPLIDGDLDSALSGEFTGQKYNDKSTSASCTSRRVSSTWSELKCIVFIDNERAATLTM